MHIAFATDDNYAVHLATVLTTIIDAHSEDFYATFHVLDCGISSQHKDALRAVLANSRCAINFHEVLQNMTLGASTPDYISPATLARLLLPSLLTDVNKVLYLDIDIAVIGDLHPLWETDLTGNCVAMVESFWTKYKDYKAVVGLEPNQPYYNAGVMLIDLAAWRDNGETEHFLNYFHEEKENLEYADQDVINYCLRGRIKTLHPEWNVPSGLQNWRPGHTLTFGKAEHEQASLSPKIAHYTGRKKPWSRTCSHALANHFRRAARRTPWPDKSGTVAIDKSPLVSVIMAVHNEEQFLHDSVSSILAQTYANFEFIVVNDASTDRTRDILMGFAEEDNRLKILDNEEQLSLAASLNKAIGIAEGEYIARMDGDDISFPDRLQKQVDFLETHRHISVLGTKVAVIRALWWESKEYSYPILENDRDIKINFLRRPGIIHPTVMMRASSLKEHGILYNPLFLRSQDYELWTRMAFKHWLKFHNLQEPLLHYRVRGGDRSSNLAIQENYKMMILSDLLNRLGSGDNTKRLQFHALWAAGKLPKSKGMKINDKALMNHFTFLVEANNKKKLFGQQSFRKFLFEETKKEVFYSFRSGWKAWARYRKSPVKNHLGLSEEDERIFRRRCLLWEGWMRIQSTPVIGFLVFIAIAIGSPARLYRLSDERKG
jgi:lipopolysaccharide biosynthesis glycosyltransferase